MLGSVLVAVSAFLPEVHTVSHCAEVSGSCFSLPAGVENALTTFSGSLHGLIDIIPFLEVPFELLMYVLAIKFALFAWAWVRYLLGLFAS